MQLSFLEEQKHRAIVDEVKRKINKYIARMIRPYDRLRLSSRSGIFYSEPTPAYISQFIGIYPSSIQPEVPIVNQAHVKEFGAQSVEEFNIWAWRDCGIACVKMILDSYNKTQGQTIMSLTNEGVALGGYISRDTNGVLIDKGWLHLALVQLLRSHGVPAVRKRWQTPEAIASNVLKNKKTIISVSIPQRRSLSADGSYQAKPGAIFGGHLLLVTGVEIDRGHVKGIYAHDPIGLEHYQSNTYIPREILEKIYSNRSIVAG